MGADYIQYIVTDKVASPLKYEHLYSEKVPYMYPTYCLLPSRTPLLFVFYSLVGVWVIVYLHAAQFPRQLYALYGSTNETATEIVQEGLPPGTAADLAYPFPSYLLGYNYGRGFLYLIGDRVTAVEDLLPPSSTATSTST